MVTGTAGREELTAMPNEDPLSDDCRTNMSKYTPIPAVLLTHAHLDRTGRIPLLIERGFRGAVPGPYRFAATNSQFARRFIL
jgi:predicted metal-dependent RNase